MNNFDKSIRNSKGKFRNTNIWKQPSFWEYLSTMKDFMFLKNERVPKYKLPVKMVDLSYFKESNNNQLNITWLGHSSLMVNIDGYKILTDPVFESKISFFGPTRYNGNVPLNISDLPEIDVVIISHNHYDHLNKPSIRQLKGKVKKFIVPLEVGKELVDCGVSPELIHEMDWWDELNIDSNLMIAATPSQHFSGRRLTDRDKSLWASWVIKTDNHKIFFGADSGYFDGFVSIGEKNGPFDMTFIESGAYNEMWHHIHMYPEETAQAHIDLKGNILHPIHWGTFNLSLHSWYEPMVRLAAAADKMNIRIATPIPGETTVFDSYIPSERWWEIKGIKR
jgi:L-ascorbate metabolism protein UlaG (beta-lactamase superfamily)